MIGRAGRDGNPSTSVLFCNRSELKHCKDTSLGDVVMAKENCRRSVLLKGLGDETSHSNPLCCDICGHLPVPTLRFFLPIKSRRKQKPKAVRNVSEDVLKVMKERLLSERKAIICNNSAFMALGGAFVCPVASIDLICQRVNFISELSDITNIPGIRSQFAEKLFNVVKDSLVL